MNVDFFTMQRHWARAACVSVNYTLHATTSIGERGGSTAAWPEFVAFPRLSRGIFRLRGWADGYFFS